MPVMPSTWIAGPARRSDGLSALQAKSYLSTLQAKSYVPEDPNKVSTKVVAIYLVTWFLALMILD